MKLISDILICAVSLDFGSRSTSIHGSLRVRGFVGHLEFRVGVSASYSYFRVSRKITTFVIREKFSRNIASIVNYIPWIFTENNTLLDEMTVLLKEVSSSYASQDTATEID